MSCQDSEMKELNIDKLRGLVRNYLERHHYEAAVFWGDKVVTLTAGDPIDVYWLAQAYIQTHQYHRACLLINTHNLAGNGSLCYLSALCHFKVQEYQEALKLLELPGWPVAPGGGAGSSKGGGSKDGASSSSQQDGFLRPIPVLDDVVALECSRQVLRAKVYEATDNPSLASDCYQAALLADPLCYDALKALTDHHMLSLQEERDLHDALPLDAHCHTHLLQDLVRVCYQTKLNKYAVEPVNVKKTSKDNSPALPVVNRPKVDLDNLPDSVSILSTNLDIITARAERLYCKCSFVPCFQLTRTVLEQDPYHTECLPIHIACLIELQQSNALFLLAHKLVDLYPETALAWFAVGCYYYLIGKNEHARRYLSKATTIDGVFGPAWIAFAHSFAAENEHDQASAAYFKAAQLMKGSHLPLLYIGMEYSLTNNPKFAEKFFQKAVEMAPEDPFVLHELGVVNFNNQQYETAEMYLVRAVEVVQSLYGEANCYYNIPSKWTTLLNNLGHTLRKRGKYRQALHFHNQAVRLLPSEASTFTAMALCLGLVGELEEAIEALHNSLSLHRDQTVATTLLNTLMDQMANTEQPFPDEEDVQLPQYTNILDSIAGEQKEPAAIPLPCLTTPDNRARPPLGTLLLHDTPGTDTSMMSQGVVAASSSLALEEEEEEEEEEGAALLCPDTSTDLLETSSVLSATSPTPAAGNTTNRSLLSIEDMIMDEDSD